MLRNILLSLVMVCLSVTCAFAKAEPIATSEIRFMGIEWNSSAEHVEQTMVSAGFKKYLTRNTSLGSVTGFSGRLANKDVHILFLFTELKLVKVMVTTEELSFLHNEYLEMQSVLVAKYGAPLEDEELYFPPYEKGDGHFDTGISVEKIVVQTVFKDTTGVQLYLNIDKSRKLVLSYETPAFKQASSAQKAKENAAF